MEQPSHRYFWTAANFAQEKKHQLFIGQEIQLSIYELKFLMLISWHLKKIG